MCISKYCIINNLTEVKRFHLSPRKSADPLNMPTPSTAFGRTNIDEPTVLLVTSSDAENTFEAASTVLGPGVGISNRPTIDATLLSAS